MQHRGTVAVTTLVAAVVLTACSGGGGSDTPDTTPSSDALAAEVATYEVVAGTPDRFLLGLFTADGVVSYGTVQLRFSWLGDGSASPTPGGEATGTFLLIPNDDAGQPPATDAQLEAAASKPPQLTQPDQIRGVYQANDVVFDSPGIWQVDATVEVDGAPLTASANFPVVDEPAYPAVGEKAPAVENHVMDEPGAKPPWVDSRATDSWKQIPDPVLHGKTVRDALREHKPLVIVVTTPLYCQSRFCGPVTAEVVQLADEFGDDANFVHLEVWRDYQKKVVNEAAATYVYHGEELTEPWIFLVDADGRIEDRWQNVADPRELRAALSELIGPREAP